MQRIADLLVEDGLALYRPNPAHKRAKMLEIAPAGLTALHRMRALFDQLAQRTSAGLEPEHLDHARHTLDELRQRLEAELPGLPEELSNRALGCLADPRQRSSRAVTAPTSRTTSMTMASNVAALALGDPVT